jgi:hypothetical protein
MGVAASGCSIGSLAFISVFTLAFVCDRKQSQLRICEALIIHQGTRPVMNAYRCRRKSSSLCGLLLLFGIKPLREKVFQTINSIPPVKIREQSSCFGLSLRAYLQLETIGKVRL